MQYQYPPSYPQNYVNQPHHHQSNLYPQYPQPQYQNSNLREQYYEPAQQFSQYHPHYQHSLQVNHNQQQPGYWPSAHNVPAALQRQNQRSRIPMPSNYQGNINNQKIHEVVYEQQQINPPQSIRQVEYVPYEKRYVDYVAQRVQIPVQKYLTDYYQIEHVVDFVPRQYQDTVVEMVPQEVIRYRLEYVPVQKKIIHMNKNDIVNFQKNAVYGQKVQQLPISQAQINNVNTVLHKQISRVLPAQTSINRTNMEGSRVSNKSNLSRRSRKTNYVTADNYNPAYREEELYQQSRVVNNYNDDKFMKRQTQKQTYRNTKLTQSNSSQNYR